MSTSTTSTTTTFVDLLIIGGGPAGLAAASFFSRLRRPCMVYDSGLYRNASSPSAHTILGHESADPAGYRRRARAELEAAYAWTQWRHRRVTRLRRADDAAVEEQGGAEGRFEAVDDAGERVVARKVVLATGIQDVLPDIPGLTEQWGKRIIHCIFCHGTETALAPFAFLLPPSNALTNPKVAEGAFKLWPTLGHTRTYFLTHGADPLTEEGKRLSGLEEFMPLIKANPDKYEIITSPISTITSTPTSLCIHFTPNAHPPLSVPYLAVFPSALQPSPHSAPLLTPDLLQAQAPLTPMGGIAPPGPDVKLGVSAFPPRMGEDPRTAVEGLYWAGNAGSPMANVNLAVAQGQTAAAWAADALATEDLRAEMTNGTR